MATAAAAASAPVETVELRVFDAPQSVQSYAVLILCLKHKHQQSQRVA